MNGPTIEPQRTGPAGKGFTFLWGLAGTVCGGFLPGAIWSFIGVYVLGEWDPKFGREGTFQIALGFSGIVTAGLAAAFLPGVLLLWFVARVRRPWHAFWVALLAAGTTQLAIISGFFMWFESKLALDFGFNLRDVYEPATVLVAMHFIGFTLLCIGYGLLMKWKDA